VTGTTTLHFPLLVFASSLENGAPYFYVERIFFGLSLPQVS
jgi:hypothetical protein